MMKIKKIEAGQYDSSVNITYSVEHISDDFETVLSMDMIVSVKSPAVYAKPSASVTMTLGDCEAKTPIEAIDRMSQWLKRMSEALDENKNIVSIPV